MTSSSGSDKRWSTTKTLIEVSAERSRQDARWGEQNHPDGTDAFYRRFAEHYRDQADKRDGEGLLTWRNILLEEVWEAMAETDPVRLREELIQVAAVAVAWIEAIDRGKNES